MGSASSKTTGGGGISAGERWKVIQNVTNDFFEFPATRGGFVLTAEQRVRIANLTLNGTLECTACAAYQLPKNACLKPGADLYDAIAKGHDQKQHGDDDDDGMMIHIIHSVVNHQAKISHDPTWYQRTMERLKATSSLLDETRMKQDGLTSEQQREYLYHGLFVEIVMVAAAVHCLHMTTIMKGLDEPAPTPIPAKKDATPPAYLDWSQVFKPDKAATYNPQRATMPYIGRADIDSESPLLLKLLPDGKDRKTLLSKGLLPMTPFLCIAWDPVDFLWMDRLADVLYMAVDDFFSPCKALDPTVRCADKFSRHDVEIVAVAVSEGYDCLF